MGPVEALQKALSLEEEAIRLYQKLSLDHADLKELFDFLINEEFKHRQLLEKKIQQVTKY